MAKLPDPDAVSRHLRLVLGDSVRPSRQYRALYATDASNYRAIPLAVVIPRSTEELAEAVWACVQAGFPLTVRGAGTSLAGQACNRTVIIDVSKHLRTVKSIDPDSCLAWVEPGVTLGQLDREAAAVGLAAVPDPSTKEVATLSGMYQNNSCGVRSVAYGTTADNVRAVEGLTADGGEFRLVRSLPDGSASRALNLSASLSRKLEASISLARSVQHEIERKFPRIPRRISGYSVDALVGPSPDFVRALGGSEGTLAVITGLEVTLHSRPKSLSLAVLGFSDILEAARAVPEILAYRPIGLEAIDEELVERCRASGRYEEGLSALPSGRTWLLAEFGGDNTEEAFERALALAHRHSRPKAVGKRKSRRPRRSMSGGTSTTATTLCWNSDSAAVLTGPEAEYIWAIRKAALAMATLNPKGPKEFVGWEDAAVHPKVLAGYLEAFLQLRRQFGLGGAIFGHFGDGCVHTHTNFDFQSPQGRQRFAEFLHQAAELVASFGGSLSGEHGDGRARGPLLEIMFGAELVRSFEKLKDIWDPDGLLNPGRLVRSESHISDLRPSLEPKLRPVRRGFRAADSERPLAETLGYFDGCVGAGACVNLQAAASGASSGASTMCPTFVATRLEEHSTRGRARLLFETGIREILEGGWDCEDTAASLAYCIGCKACKSECPASVDMAKFRSEFFYQRWGDLGIRLRLNSPKSRGFRLPRLSLSRRPVGDTLVGLAPFVLHFLRAISPNHRAAVRLWNLARRLAISELVGLETFPALHPLDPESEGEDSNTNSTLSFLGDTEAARRSVAVLFPDCFTTNFRSRVFKAARFSLEALGWRVVVPRGRHTMAPLCCARPLIEEGMLGTARFLLRRTARVLASLGNGGTMGSNRSRPDPARNNTSRIKARLGSGVPLVVLEPACLSVFRDEMDVLLDPSDLDLWHRLGPKPLSLAELLSGSEVCSQPWESSSQPGDKPNVSHKLSSGIKDGGLGAKLSFEARRPGSEVALFPHCHQRALWGTRADTALLDVFNYRFRVLDVGCCGGAGKFGFLAKYNELSKAIYDACVRRGIESLEEGIALVADGFSCSRRLADETGRAVYHTAELVAAALMDCYLEPGVEVEGR